MCAFAARVEFSGFFVLLTLQDKSSRTTADDKRFATTKIESKEKRLLTADRLSPFDWIGKEEEKPRGYAEGT